MIAHHEKEVFKEIYLYFIFLNSHALLMEKSNIYGISDENFYLLNALI